MELEEATSNVSSPFSETQGESSIALYVIPTSLICLLVACYLAVSLCTVIGNAMVLYIVAKSRRMQSVTNYFIANLSASDLMTGALAIPFQFQAALLQKWVLPYFMCSFCPTVQVVSLNVSIFTLVVIALDRYRAVIYPLHAKTSRGSAKIAIAFIWGFSILFALPTYIGLKVTFIMDPETGNYTKPLCDVVGMDINLWRVYSHILVALQYFIPLCIISYAYIFVGITLCYEPSVLVNSGTDLTNVRRIKRKVVKSGVPLATMLTILGTVLLQGEREGRGTADQFYVTGQVVQMLFIVITLFAICWFPFQMYNVLQEVYPSINEALNEKLGEEREEAGLLSTRPFSDKAFRSIREVHGYVYRVLQEIYPSINEYKYINITWFSFHLLAMSNSCHNPFIYFLYSERFNSEFKRHFSPYLCAIRDNVPDPILGLVKLSAMASSSHFPRPVVLRKARSAPQPVSLILMKLERQETLRRSFTFPENCVFSDRVTAAATYRMVVTESRDDGGRRQLFSGGKQIR